MSVAATSTAAYRSIKTIGNKQRVVYHVIEDLQPVTNEQIAEHLGWEINRVTGRVNELVRMGFVVQYGYGKTKTGRKAKAWVVK